ncbi:hypothetical protein MKW94_028283 [Papaver nudicaule]|uniref:Sister chromatid cohesion protein SCC4 n=1 Tax=Papaver nudicaule TaxID=74823 RepID=A0AA41VZV4_PAPNU|nr:hypothetical protein [Papaver nudicaule]
MEGLAAEGLWELADFHEQNFDIGKTVKCLEAICQSQISFSPIVEIKSRLRIASLLLTYTHNINHAKSHLERSELLLKSIPACLELKCRVYSLLSQCYYLLGAIPSQKQIINKGLGLVSRGDGFEVKLWYCNFTSQLANALSIEGDYRGSTEALERGFSCAAEMCYPELQMYFATSIFHVHMMQWDSEDLNSVTNAAVRCNEIWESLQPDKRRQCMGLFFYNELLNTFYQLRVCDYKTAGLHVDQLDEAMRNEKQQIQQIKNLTAELNTISDRLSQSDLHNRERLSLYKKQTQLQEQLRQATSSAGMESMKSSYLGNARQMLDKLELAPPPIDGDWLPRSAVYVLVDLLVVISGRPKGLFKECGKRTQSGLQLIKEELMKLGITDGVREVNLQRSAIWIAGVYLTLLMQFLENKIAVDLTRSEFVEAQEALLQMKDWFIRFPTILQGCEGTIEMLRGQYAHSVGCFSEAAFHFLEAAKLTESKSVEAMCLVYAAVSHICIGDAESSSQALNLIGSVYGVMDSFVGVREKTSVLFAYGLLLIKQDNLQEARVQLASGLRITHHLLGNIQLISQYLTLFGSLALALHDITQAKEFLESSLTLAKTLCDIPTQIWVVSVLTGRSKFPFSCPLLSFINYLLSPLVN